MKILNRNTFSEDSVTTKKLITNHPTPKEDTLVYIGSNSYLLEDLEKIISKIKTKKSGDDKFVESLNYRVNFDKE
jgi:hypothetical protein